MTQPKIKTAAASDEAPIAAVLALAFSTDPGARWAWTDPQQLLTHFPAFVKALGGAAFTSGSAYYVDGYAGAALWLPPDVRPDEEALNALLEPQRLRADCERSLSGFRADEGLSSE